MRKICSDNRDHLNRLVRDRYSSSVRKIEHFVFYSFFDKLVAVGIAPETPVLVDPFGDILVRISLESACLLAQLQNVPQRAADFHLLKGQVVDLDETLIEENKLALGVKHQ